MGKAIIAALLSVLALATLILLDFFTGMRPDPFIMFMHALAVSTLLALVPLAVLWFLDRREREGLWLFLAAFLWGGCIATALALPINQAVFKFFEEFVAHDPESTELFGPDAALLMSAQISPFIEELAKALGVLLLFWLLRPEFDNMRDGLIYGALVGIGFNWFEAALYGARGYIESGVPMFGLELGMRYGLFGFGSHAMFTAIFGAFLGLTRQTRRTWLRIVAPVLGLMLAIAAHLLNNMLTLVSAIEGAHQSPSEVGPLANLGFLASLLLGFAGRSLLDLIIFVPFVLIMAIAIWRSGVWERRVIREELASEVGHTVTEAEYQAVVSDRILRTQRLDRMHPQISAALVKAQHELAFRKRRVRNQGGDPEQDGLVAGWREDIRRLRLALAVSP